MKDNCEDLIKNQLQKTTSFRHQKNISKIMKNVLQQEHHLKEITLNED